VLGTRLTFFNDEWYLLLQRPGLSADSIFQPSNEHLIALPVLIYKGLIAAFGFDSQLPYRLLLAATVVALAVAVFAFVRERAGQLLALLSAAVLLFLGPAWEDLLWSFQIGFIGSLAAGVGVLLALQRESPRRNIAACALLVVSILLSDLGISFVVAAAVAVLLRRRPSQLWIPATPALLFAAWWIAYGHEASSHLTLRNLAQTPQYVLDSVASGLASLVGLARYSDGSALDTYTWGRPLLAVAVLAVAVWLSRGGRPRPFLLVVAAAALSFWILAAANYTPGREPGASRYQLISASFVVLLAAEAFRPVRLRPAGLASATLLALVVIGANLGALNDGYKFMRTHSAIAEADLGALEIARGHAPPQFRLANPVAHTDFLGGVTADAYFRESDQHGSPADSPEEILAAPPDARQAADSVLAAGYRLGLAPARTPRHSRQGCQRVAPGSAGTAGVELPPGGALISNLGAAPTAIAVRRFAPPDRPIGLGILGPGLSTPLRVPVDSVGLPWYLLVSDSAPLEVCG
jgi:hypothetical protein